MNGVLLDETFLIKPNAINSIFIIKNLYEE